MKKYLFYFTGIFILLCSINCFSQTVTHLTKENSGLNEDKIWSIAVDNDGNKWIGTGESGLVKFDDEKWITLNKKNSLIKGNYISPIFVDSNNNIWVSYSRPYGLVKFDGQNWKNYTIKDLKLSKMSIIDITEDENGILYFGGQNGLTTFDGEVWKKIELPKSITIRALAVKNSDLIYIGHNKGLLVYENGIWKSLNSSNSELKSYVRSLKINKQGELIIGYGGGSEGGLSILKDEQWNHFNKENSSLSDNLVRDIEIDDFENYWLATNKGFNVMTKGKIFPLLFTGKQNAILDIATEGKTFWLATHFGLFKIEY
jgi:ligand-binding sensor domain-containing protein